MPKRSPDTQKHHALYCEVVVAAIEALPADQRPSQTELAQECELSSTASIWALMNRKSKGRPGLGHLKTIANSLGLDDKEVDRRIARLSDARDRVYLPAHDGRLWDTAASVSPQSFLLQAACNGNDMPVHLRDIYSADELAAHAGSRDLLERRLRSPLQIYPDQILEACVVTSGSVPVTSSMPRALFLTQHRAQELEVKRVRQFGRRGMGLVGLKGWAFRMSPDFVLIDRKEEGRELDPYPSAFAKKRADTGSHGAAMDWLVSQLRDRTFLVSRKFLSSRNVRLLYELLVGDQGAAPTTQEVGVVRHALLYLRSGLLDDNCVAVGGGPHYWAAVSEATRPGGRLRVLVTDEDLVGRPEGMKASARDHAQSPIGDDPDSHSEAWREGLADLAARWQRECGRLVFRAEGGEPEPELDCLARYLCKSSSMLKRRWNEGTDSQRRELARVVLDGFGYWGGAGADMQLGKMIQFIEYGMDIEYPSGVSQFQSLSEFTD